MDTKFLLTGIICFISGALLVSIAATTFDKKEVAPDSMSTLVESLKDKSGDDFDEAFITGMIAHHEGAIEMAKMAELQAKHEEIKKLSNEILSAQSKEIDLMQTWQGEWGYKYAPQTHTTH